MKSVTLRWRFSFGIPSKLLALAAVQSTVGKKKDKEKVKAKDAARPGRKDLESEIVTLRQQNASLKARLDTIAEIAGANPDGAGEVNFQLDKQKP